MTSVAHETTQPTLGERLRQLRRAAGLSQEALAERARLATRTVQYLEARHAQRPHRETLRLVLAALGVEPQEVEAFAALANDGRDAPFASHDLMLVDTKPFFGRTRERDSLARELALPGIVTVTGMAGVGKSTLAFHAAAGAAGFGERVAVALQPLVDGRHLTQHVALTLGAASGPRDRLRAAIRERLRGGRALIVFDGAEHLAEMPAFVNELVADLLELTVLVTSRFRLGLAAERLFRLEPFPPSAERNGTDHPAIELFLASARSAGVALDESHVALIAKICNSLDGLPLAIELAGSLASVMTPATVFSRLDERMNLLRATSSEKSDRHRSLRAALGWSYDLLTACEQRVFRACAVFAGGASLRALESMVTDSDVVPALRALVEHNMIVARVGGDGEYRFSMLDTIRAFALEAIARVNEDASLRQSHAHATAAVFDEINARIKTKDVLLALRSGDDEVANLRDAFETALRCEAVELALRLAAAAQRYWEHRDRSLEAREWDLRVLAAAADEHDLPPALVARVEIALGANCIAQGDVAAARAACERARERATAANDDLLIGIALQNLALIALSFDRDYAAAEPLFRSALDRLENPAQRSVVAGNLAATLALAGRLDESDAVARRTRIDAESTGDLNGIASASQQLGANATERGDVAGSAREFLRMLDAARDLSFRSHVSSSLPYIAELAARRKRYAAAAIALGYDARLLAHLHIVRDPSYELRANGLRQMLAGAFGSEALGAGLAEGAAMEDAPAFVFIERVLADLALETVASEGALQIGGR